MRLRPQTKLKRNHPLENIEKQTTHVIVEMDTGRVDGVVGRERAAESLGACWTILLRENLTD